jgi:hypothetical protein
MTTFIPTQDPQAELDARRRTAWQEYRDGLRGLEGRAYDEAETASWDQLQATLAELEAESSPASAG